MIMQTGSKPDRVSVTLRGDGAGNDIYLRKDIALVHEPTEDEPWETWQADEKHIVASYDEAYVERNFDELWRGEPTTEEQIGGMREDIDTLADTVLALCDIIEDGE